MKSQASIERGEASPTLTSRKTQQDVRLQLDRLDYTMLEEMLRRVIREELDAHEASNCPPSPVTRGPDCPQGGECNSQRCSICPFLGRAYG